MINIIGLKQYKKENASKICLGVFDGFHIGHQELMKQAEYLVTFYPHPKTILQNSNIKLLTTQNELNYFTQKKRIVIPFTKHIAQTTALEFLDNIIGPYLKPSKIIIGYDFKFGINQQGNYQMLKKWGESNHCEVTQISKKSHSDNTTYKSSIIRRLLMTDFNKALSYLGHPYLIIGKVIHGEKRGKKLGFPTANLHVKEAKLVPKQGVYQGYVILSNKKYPAIIYIGNKPTFQQTSISIEVHILNNFNQNLYGRFPKVFLTKFIRESIQFNTNTELIKQINQDIKTISI